MCQRSNQTDASYNLIAPYIRSQEDSISRRHDYSQQKTVAAQNTDDHEKCSLKINACFSATDPFLAKVVFKTTVNCMKKALQTEYVLGGPGAVSKNLLAFPETSTLRKIVSLVEDVVR